MLIGLQTLLNNRISTLADDQDAIIGSLYNNRHALSGAVEFNDIEKFVTALAVPCLANHVSLVVAALKREAKMARTVDKS